MKILIVGIDQEVGKHLAQHLLKKNWITTILGLRLNADAVPHPPESSKLKITNFEDDDSVSLTMVEEYITTADAILYLPHIVPPNHSRTHYKNAFRFCQQFMDILSNHDISHLLYIGSIFSAGINRDHIWSNEVFFQEHNNPSKYAKFKYYEEIEFWRAHHEGKSISILLAPPIEDVNLWPYSLMAKNNLTQSIPSISMTKLWSEVVLEIETRQSIGQRKLLLSEELKTSPQHQLIPHRNAHSSFFKKLLSGYFFKNKATKEMERLLPHRHG